MSLFRRSIRRRLMADGKVYKYIAYGAGEIALIVIGILLALQVNDWKEGLEHAALEQTLLSGFVRDLQQDTTTLTRGIVSTKRWAERREFLLERTEYGSIPLDSLTELATRTFSTGHFTLVSTTFRKLESYSNGYPIRDPEILDRIIRYYTTAMGEHDRNLHWDESSTDDESRMLWYATDFETVPLKRALGLEEEFPTLKSPEQSKQALLGFLTTERVRNAYRLDYYRKIQLNRYFTDKKKETTELLEQIEEYLATNGSADSGDSARGRAK